MKSQIAYFTTGIVLLGTAMGSAISWANTERARERDILRELQSQGTSLSEMRLALEEAGRISCPRASIETGGVNAAVLPSVPVVATTVPRLPAQHEANLQTKKPEITAPTRENIEGFSEAEHVLAVADETGSWTNAEAYNFRQALAHVTGAQAEVLLKELSVAINDGRYSLQVSGPLF